MHLEQSFPRLCAGGLLLGVFNRNHLIILKNRIYHTAYSDQQVKFVAALRNRFFFQIDALVHEANLNVIKELHTQNSVAGTKMLRADVI